MTFGTFYQNAMLPYSSAYDFGIEMYHTMLEKMTGKPGAAGSHDYGVLAELVRFTGNGDYLEIGSAYGYSAILTSLVKRHYKLNGTVTCIDPLNWTDPKMPDVPIDRETLEANARLFGVELEIIQERSTPLPTGARHFAAVFIDGDHTKQQPTRDWQAVKDIADKLVIFHDYDEKHPEVVNACLLAANDPGWIPLHIFGITFALKKKRGT